MGLMPSICQQFFSEILCSQHPACYIFPNHVNMDYFNFGFLLGPFSQLSLVLVL